jgi:pimeloyl-ACP methyl ester carboxylesterase
MKKLVGYFTLILLISSCLRLDDFLYSNEKVDQYLFDAYQGSKELPALPVEYNVGDSMRTLFTLESNAKEGSAKIYAVYIGDMNRIATDTVILYCHGNADHMDRYWNRAKLLANVGYKHRYGVLMFDYRGYGMSQSKSTENTLYADTDAALKWLKAKGLSNNRLIIYGYSLGSCPSTEISANVFSMKPSKLILEAPFASSEMMVNDASKLVLPASYFTSVKIDNAEEIKKVQQPFMWLHGTKDDFLSIETHGEVVYKNYRGPHKEAHRIEGALHGDLPAVMGYENYLNALLRFLER